VAAAASAAAEAAACASITPATPPSTLCVTHCIAVCSGANQWWLQIQRLAHCCCHPPHLKAVCAKAMKAEFNPRVKGRFLVPLALPEVAPASTLGCHQLLRSEPPCAAATAVGSNDTTGEDGQWFAHITHDGTCCMLYE
jgi:hypothetical protein